MSETIAMLQVRPAGPGQEPYQLLIILQHGLQMTSAASLSGNVLLGFLFISEISS